MNDFFKKKRNLSIPIVYNKDVEEVVSEINEDVPIKIEQEFIDYVHAQYPLLSKEETAKIIVKTLTVIREFFIKGYVTKLKIPFFYLKLMLVLKNNKFFFGSRSKRKLSKESVCKK